MNFSPELLPNRITNAQIKNKKMNKELSAGTGDEKRTKDDVLHVSPACIKPNVVRPPLSVCELRVGNYVKSKEWGGIGQIDGIEKTPFGFQVKSKGYLHCFEDGKYFDLEPILLTEENILKLRRNQSDDFQPIEFSKTPPGERQVENNFWSNWINDDYRFHLSPSYGYDWINDKAVKSDKIEFWFCWYSSQGQWFLSVKNIRGENQLKYVHQLQNLFYQLSGYDLVLR
jgi:hypothetical protein